MKIVFITPGAGTRFYCENCARDGTLFRGLISRGHEVIACPMYLPLNLNEPSADIPIFYGAVNLYLSQIFPVLQRAPDWVEHFLDSPAFLKIASSLSGSTDAPGLGEMTVSMLRGEDGNQKKDLRKLVDWLKTMKPELVHISNGLLLGVAGMIKRELGVPVLCSLQDEDTWIDEMDEPYRSDAWKLMSDSSSNVDLFLPVSGFYAEAMRRKLSLKQSNIEVIPNGIDASDSLHTSRPFNPPVIGYLSRISEAMGIRLLVDAFVQLKKNDRFRDVKLRITGGSTAGDRAVQRDIRRLKGKAKQDVEILPYTNLGSRADFFSSLTVLSVPVLKGEAQGTFMLEAMAAGVPVVQPALGGFPEIIEATGGGIVYEPNTAEALTEAIAGLLADPERLTRLGLRGRDSVLSGYTVEHMAEKIERAYIRCLQGKI